MASVFLNVLSLHPGHNWGGDFAQYILHARNLATGRPYSAGIMLDNRVLFPPGFPCLLMPVIKIFGLNLKLMKLWNILFWYGAVWLLSRFVTGQFSKRISSLYVLLFCFSAYFFSFKQNVLSDVPFVFFVLATLAMFSEYEKNIGRPFPGRPSWLTLSLAVASLSIAFCLRAAGVALVFAVIYYFMVIRRRIKLAVFLLGVFSGLFVFLNLTVGSAPGDILILLEQPLSALESIGQNYPLMIRSLWVLSFPVQSKLSLALYLGVLPALDVLALVFYVGFCCCFAYRSFEKRLSLPETFCFFYFLLLLIGSAFANTPGEFARFVLPLWGFFLMAFMKGLLWIGENPRASVFRRGSMSRFIQACLIMMIIANMANIVVTYPHKDDVLFEKEQQELFSWVRGHLRPEDHYMFWHPRTMALMTDRVGTDRWNHPSQQGQLVERVRDLDIRYLILDRGIDRDLILLLAKGYLDAELVWENRQYQIFEIM